MRTSSTGAWCEYPGCKEEAWYRVEAQWSVVDFVAYETCVDHLHDFYEHLSGSMVEGATPDDVWTTTLDFIVDSVQQLPPRD